jgi:hypothetical protein
MKDIVYFELNDWSAYEDYPPEEPYIDWCCIYKNEDGTYHLPKLRNEKWLKENGLIVVESLLDMSMNFCITAPKTWVNENCPNLLTTWSKFIRIPEDEDDVPCGRWDTPFLPYEEKYIGYHYTNEEDDGFYHIVWK